MRPITVSKLTLILFLGLFVIRSAGEEFKMPSSSKNEAIPVNAPGPEEILGGYTQGCIIGATQFETSTDGWELMNTTRNHHYGHSSLIHFTEHLAATSIVKGWGKLAVGDSSCPAGMKMGEGHTSHRVGLDVDIFFRLIPLGTTLTHEERNSWSEDEQEKSEIAKYSRSVGEMTSMYKPEHLELVRVSAEYGTVERIFVSPPIKAEICKRYVQGEGENTQYPAWIKKVRPWSGHKSHFHVRLKCPKSSPECKPQGAVGVDHDDATGVGCAGRDFLKWFKKSEPKPKPEPEPETEHDPNAEPNPKPDKPKEPKKPKPLPGWLVRCEEMEASLEIIDITSETRCLVEKEPILVKNGEVLHLLRCRDFRRAETFNRYTRCTGGATEKDPAACVLSELPSDRLPQSKLQKNRKNKKK